MVRGCYTDGFSLRKFVIVAAITLLIAYGLYNARYLLFGPQIAIISPQSKELITRENNIVLEGTVLNMTYLSLNGRQIFADTKGNFNERILLVPGENYVEIKALDRFKNESQKKLRIYYVMKDPE